MYLCPGCHEPMDKSFDEPMLDADNREYMTFYMCDLCRIQLVERTDVEYQ